MAEIQEEIRKSIETGHKWIDDYAYSIKTYVRIISDVEVPFPDYNRMVGFRKDMEVRSQRWHETNGWGKPDAEIHGIEIFYLWKSFKP